MNNYKACPLKKRPVFFDYENQQSINVDKPQDLSLKRAAEDELHREAKRNFVLNLSTNSVYDRIKNVDIAYQQNYRNETIIDRPESPISTSSETSMYMREASVSPRSDFEYSYPSIHLRGLSQKEIYAAAAAYHQQQQQQQHQQRSSLFTPYQFQSHHVPEMNYHLTPPSSPGSTTTEPEDLSMKSYIPLPALYHGFHQETLIPTTAPMITTKPKDNHRYKCEQCGKSYSTITGLSKHQQFHCPAAECNQTKKTFACKSCDKVYTSLGALKMHIRTHTLPCKCPICGKAFSRPWLLQGHIRTHTGEKPFSCNQCNRAFADRSNLRAHQQTHVEVKRYICPSCNKSFSRMSLLSKHQASGCHCSSS